jgi:streptogramin lyase
MKKFLQLLVVFAVLMFAPVVAVAQSLQTFSLPFAGAGPWDIVLGSDGNMWATQGGVGDSLPTKIARVSPAGQITEFFTPSRNRTGSIVSGPDGKLWFTIVGFPTTIGNATTAGNITEFCDSSGTTTPGTCSQSPQDLVFGPDGNIWFTEHVNNAIVKMNPVTGSFTYYSIGAFGFGAQGITVGPDGALWFTINSTVPAIGRIDTAGNITTFPMATGSDPRDITLGPDGNLWFTQPRGNSIGRITPAGAITLFALATPASFPWAIVTGPDGNLWFTQHDVNRIARITPAGVVTEVIQTTGGPWGIAPGAGNTMWVTLREGNRVGRFTVVAAAAATLSSLALNPNTVVGGNPSSGVVVLSEAAPIGGAVVSLTNSASSASVPAMVTVPAGASSANFSILTSAVAATASASISATYLGVSRNALLSITPSQAAPPTPTAPTLLSPLAGATGLSSNVNFDWGDVANATSYELHVDDDAAFTAPIRAVHLGNVSEASVSGLPAQVLWWRVRAKNSVGIFGPYSTARSFTPQVSSPTMVTLTVSASGRNGQRISSTPTGINVSVGASQTASFPANNAVTLTVSNDRSATWSGACSSGGNRVKRCTFTITSNALVTANVQ